MKYEYLEVTNVKETILLYLHHYLATTVEA